MSETFSSFDLMTYCILFFLGLGIFWLCLQTAEEVHQLALAAVGLFTICWGYLFSPTLFQWLSGSLVLVVSHIYLATVKSLED